MSAICAWDKDAIHLWDEASGETEGFELQRFTAHDGPWMPCPAHLIELNIADAHRSGRPLDGRWLHSIAKFAASRGVNPEQYAGLIMERLRPLFVSPGSSLVP